MKATRQGLVLTSKRKLLTLAVASCFAGELAYANPTGPSVAQGQATIATQGNVLTVTNTPGAVINWQSFSVASQEITRFLQQSAASTVLNRVVGVNPSTILGTLQSNGRVFLINPNGITIGQGATIDVAGFLASTLNLSDADFLAGRYRFTQSTGTGSVVNQGTINTPAGGMVYLVGQNVENQGIIKSPKGEILLAAGKSIELVDAGTPEIRVQITAPDNQVLNLGQLLASGGRIGMYGGLVRQGGVASANTAVVGENGKIVFKAVKDVKLDAGSVTTANGPTGGSITVEADTGKATVAGSIEANGTAGRGGTINVSGQQGVSVESTGRVSANGTDGGAVALSSSAGSVQVAGQVSASANTGRGGQVAVVAATQSSISSGAIVAANGQQGGGAVTIKAGDSASVDAGGVIQVNGTSGGVVTVNAEQGSVVIGGTIEATGSEAQGGTIQVAALNDVTLGDTSILSAFGRRGGEARIEAREGTTLGSGAIDASGKDGPGGKVQLLGPQVGLYREATINVSGKTGGGIALVGGDYQGRNPDVPNAQRTYIGPNVLITANAIETGNGGKVIIWADNDTRSLGSITARGGAQSGDGGFIETSGKHYLEVGVPADASAPNGKAGVWLLDPANVEIVAAGANTNIDTTTGGGTSTYSPFEATISANSAKIGNTVINTALDAGTNVVIDTVSAGNSEAGDITVNAAITLSSGTARNVSLSLNADGSVFVNNAISATGAGNVLNVNLGKSGVTTGSVTFGGGGSVTTQGGNVSVFAGTTVKLGSITTGAGTLGVTAGGDITQIGSLKIGGTTTLSSDTSAITATLTTAGNDFGTVSLASPTGSFTSASVTDDQNAMSIGGNAGTLSANAKGALTLTGGTYTTLNATSQTSIGQSGALTVSGTTTLSSDTSAITATLTTAGNDFGTVSLASPTGSFTSASVTDDQNAMSIGGNAGTLSANAKGALTLTGGTYTTLNATSQTSIGQSGALTVSGTTTLSSDTSAITATLTTAGNDFGTVSLASPTGSFTSASVTDDQNAMSIGGNAGTLSANAKGALTLTGGTYTTLNATSQTSIGQSGALTVSGTTTLSSDTSAITATLTTAGNDFGTVSLASPTGSFTSASVTDDQNAMSIGGNAGTLSANAKGALTLTGGTYTTLNATSQTSIGQSGALTVSGTTTLSSDTSAITATLTTAGNDFGTVSLASPTGSFTSASVTDDQNAMSIGGNAGTLSANAKGALTLTGGTYTTLNATSQTSIGQSGALTVSGTTTLSSDTSAITATLTTAGNDFGTVSLASPTGSFTSASVTDDQNAMSIGGNAGTLSANAKGALTLTGGTYTTLNATSQTSIGQSGALTVSGTTTLSSDTSAITATLTTAGNDFGTVSLASPTGSFTSASVTDDQNAMSIGGNAGTLSANAKGALTLTGGTYTTLNATSQTSIGQSGALTVSGTTTLSSDTSAITATLTTAGNDFGTVSLASPTGSFTSASVTDDQNAMSIGGNAGTLSANAKGALTLTGGTYTTLNATSQTSIGQSGALTVSGTTTLSSDTSAITATLTTAGNDFGTVSLASPTGSFTSASVTDDQNAMSIGGNAGTLSANAKGALTLTGGTYTTLNATSQTSIGQSGALTVSGTTTLSSDTSAITATLTTAGNDFGTVSLASPTGSFTSASVTDDQNAMSIGGNAGTLSANAKGALTLTGGTYTTLNATSQTSIGQSGALTVSGTTTLSSDTSAITATLTTAGNDFGTVSLASPTGSFTSASVTDDQNAMSIGGNAGTLSANAKGALTLTGGTYTTLNATSQTSIGQSGALTVSGTTTLSSDTSAITATLTTAGNDFGTVSLASPTGSFTSASVTDDQNAMSIGGNAGTLSANAKGALTLTGGTYTTLNATSQTSIGQSGALTVSGTTTLSSDTSAITATLTTAGNDFGTVSLASPTGSFTSASVTDDQNAMSIGGNAGTLSANAKGALTLTGGTYTTLNATSQTSIGQSGALTVSGTTTLSSDTSAITATLTTAGNDFGTVSLASPTGSFTSASVTDDQNAMSIGGNAGTLSANAKGALTLTGGTYTTLNATSQTSIGQSGALTVSGTTTLSSDTSAITATLTTAGNDFGTVSLASPTGSFTSASVTDDQNAMSIGGNAGTLSANAKGALTLTGGTYTTLNATSQTSIGQSGALTVSGTTTLSSDTSAITATLTTAGNDFGTVSLASPTGSFTSASVTDDQNAMSIGGNAGTLSANAKGALTLTGGTYTTLNATSQTSIGQSGALTVSGTTTLSSDTSAITATLTTAGNDFGTVSLASPTGSFTSASVTDDQNAMSIGGNAGTLSANAKGALTLTGGTYTTLNATSQTSSVGQSGTLTANALLVTAVNTSTLSDPTNDVVTVAAAISGLGQGFTYKDANAVDVGTVGTTNGITINKGDVSVTTVNGTINISKAINAGGATGGNITLTTAETAEATNAAITFAATGNLSGNAVKLNSADGITQNTSAVITAATLEVLAATDTGATGVDETVSLLGSNLVGTLAAKRNTAAAGVDLTFNYKNAQDLIIGTAGGTTGIVTGNGPIDVKAVGGKLDVNQTVNGGSVTLNSSGVMTIAAAGDIVASTGAISLTGSRIDTAGDVTTTNQDVTFNSPTTLQGDITVDAGAGNVTFSSTLDGPNALTVNSSGTTKFSGLVGNTTPLSSLTTDAAGGATINTTVVKTTGNMTFNDPVTLSANATLTTTVGGNISFGSTINADNAAANDRTLTLNSGTGTISVTGAIGNLQPLAGLTVSNSNGATFTGAVDVTDATGTVTVSDTAATKTVAFQNNLATDVFVASNNGNAYNVSFLGGSTQVNNGATFATTGTVQIGDQTADTSSIAGGITHTAGPTVLAGGITTTGAVSVNATTVPSGQTATLNAGANPVTFNTTVDGPGNLVVNSSGNTIFTGVVGGIAPLGSLQTDAGGTTKVNGGTVTTDGTGGLNFGDAVTIGGTTVFSSNGSASTGANINFDQTLTGPGGAADLTLNAGTTGNVTAFGVVSGIQNLTVSADNVNMAGGIVHSVNNVVTFNSTGNVSYAQNGNLNIGLSSVAGTASITANNGSIITGGVGSGFTAGSVVLTATDGAGTDTGTLLVGAGGISTTGSLTLKSADGMTINGPLNSHNGQITLMAGNAPGMASLGITPATNANPGGALGTVTINAPVQAGIGNITIYSTGPVSQASSATDAGVQTSNALTVRTYNDNAGAATITMENDKLTGGVTCATGNTGTGNCATQITLETRQAGDTGLSSTTSFPGGFAASEIRYKSISGTQIIGIGTASDVLLEADSWTLNSGAINGGNVNIVATGSSGGGNINVGIAIPTSFINNNLTGGSLNLRAARDINILPGGSIGTKANRFDHNLVLAAGDDISIQGPIYLNGDLNLRAKAAAGDLNGNTPFLATGNVSVSTPGATSVEVLAKNITIGDAVRPVNSVTITAGTAGTGQSADAVLKADNALNINTSGDLSATGGTATASTPSTTDTTADVLLSGANVGIVVGGNFTLTGGASTITGGAGADQKAHANSKLEGTVLSLQVTGNAAITGGTATAATGANTSTAQASVESATNLNPTIQGDLTITGGTSLAQPVAGQAAVADASAEFRSGGDLLLNVGRDLIITGGAAVASTALGGASATADSGASLAAIGTKEILVARNFTINGGSAATSGGGATATSIAGLDAGQAAATSLTLKVTTGGDLQLLGGTELGNALASAAILSAGEIKLFINGPQGLMLGGGRGSDLFQLVGPTLISLEGKGYPITVQGSFDANGSLARGDAFIISGAPPLNLDSLLAAFLRTTDCVTFSGGSCTVPGTSTRTAETTKSQAGAGVCK